MPTKLLLAALVLELISELMLSVAGIVAPAETLRLLKVQVLPDTLFLGFVLTMAFGFVAVAIALYGIKLAIHVFRPP